MAEIKTFAFQKSGFKEMESFALGRDWPVVYILENKKEVYIGETTSMLSRSRQHFARVERARLDRMHVIVDEEYNKSATLDTESLLIQYFAAEGTLRLQNGNRGLINHNYFDKARYQAKFESLWKKLQAMQLVKRDLGEIENSEMFKYSPYKALTEDQMLVASELQEAIQSQSKGTYIVNGGPGTGKTVLATFLVKALKEDEKTKYMKIGLVVPMSSLRESIQDVFSKVAGLSKEMVIGPSEAARGKYDLLIVDEAHRLRQRRNLANYAVHDRINKKLGLGKDGTELDWILRTSDHQILFFDENQSVRPTDVHTSNVTALDAKHYHLTSQLRVSGGEKYIESIARIFRGENIEVSDFSSYDFKIYEDATQMVSDIKSKNDELGLCRVVAGYAWRWATKTSPELYDIEIGDLKLRWNSRMTDWVNSSNAINEVGCIHTVQGYDLNYVGVIVGPELAYDANTDRLVINRANYKDVNGWRGITDAQELERYIFNIYKVLMTRGMKGCYVYFVDKEVEKFFRDRIGEIGKSKKFTEPVLSPFTREMIRIPLVGSAPCGSPLFGEQNIEEYILVEKSRIKPGFDYFILRAEGDSMNLAGINDGDLVLCRQQLKADTGNRVVALLGDNVTIKMYDKKDGRRILLPKSTNKSHQPIEPEEGDSVQGVVQEVINSDL